MPKKQQMNAGNEMQSNAQGMASGAKGANVLRAIMRVLLQK